MDNTLLVSLKSDNLHLAIKKDFLDILPEEIDQIEVEETCVKGSLVYKQ